jgi:hypothetical protein
MTEEQERLKRRIIELDRKIKRQQAAVEKTRRERRALAIELLVSTRDD